MKTYTVSLTEETLKVIGAALNEVPAKFSRQVLNDLEAQTKAQDEGLPRWDVTRWDVPFGPAQQEGA